MDDTGEIVLDEQEFWDDDERDYWDIPVWAFWPVWIVACMLMGMGAALIWEYIGRMP